MPKVCVLYVLYVLYVCMICVCVTSCILRSDSWARPRALPKRTSYLFILRISRQITVPKNLIFLLVIRTETLDAAVTAVTAVVRSWLKRSWGRTRIAFCSERQQEQHAQQVWARKKSLWVYQGHTEEGATKWLAEWGQFAFGIAW